MVNKPIESVIYVKKGVQSMHLAIKTCGLWLKFHKHVKVLWLNTQGHESMSRIIKSALVFLKAPNGKS